MLNLSWYKTGFESQFYILIAKSNFDVKAGLHMERLCPIKRTSLVISVLRFVLPQNIQYKIHGNNWDLTKWKTYASIMKVINIITLKLCHQMGTYSQMTAMEALNGATIVANQPINIRGYWTIRYRTGGNGIFNRGKIDFRAFAIENFPRV